MNKTLILFFVLAFCTAAAFAYTQSDLEEAYFQEEMAKQGFGQEEDIESSSDSSSSDEEISDMNRGFFKSIGKAFRRFTSGGLSGILGRVGGLISGGSDLFGRIGGLVSGGRNLIGSIGGLFRSGGGSFFSKLGNVFNQGKDLFNAGRGVFQDARGLLSGGAPSGGIQDSDDEYYAGADEDVMDSDFWGRRIFRRVGRVFRRVGRFIGRVARKVGRVIKKIAPYVLPLLGGPLGAVLGPIAGSIGGVITKGLAIWDKVKSAIDIVKSVKMLIKPPKPQQTVEQLDPEQLAQLIVARLMEIDELYKKYGKNVPKQFAFARDGKTPIAEEQKILMGKLLELKEAYEKEQAKKAAAQQPQPAQQAGGAQAIAALYRNILGRAPDAAGLKYWTGRLAAGMTIPQIQQAFLNSAEYRQRRAMHHGRVEDSESEYDDQYDDESDFE